MSRSDIEVGIGIEIEIEIERLRPIPWVEHVMGPLVKLPAGAKADRQGKGKALIGLK